jgi:hypothetical protein
MPSSQSWTTEGSKTSISKPFPVKIENSTTNYTVKTEANISQGNVTASKLTLQDTVTTRSGKQDRELAVSTDGGKTWIPTKDANGNAILSENQVKSLQSGGLLNKAIKNASKADAKTNGATDKQTNQLSNGNAASTPPAGQTDPKPTVKDLNDLAKIPGISPRDTYDNLTYPQDINNVGSDLIKFTMLKYQSRPVSETTLTFADRVDPFNTKASEEDKKRIIKGNVTMAIQPSVNDRNSVGWSPLEMDAGATAAAIASLTGMTGDVAGAVDDAMKTAELEGNGIRTAITASLAEAATGTKGLLTRVSGAMVNPNLELLFTGPQLRSFNLTFKMSPRNPSEAKQVKKIIRFFKQGMAVQRTTIGLFLKSPNTFKLQYLYGVNKKDHEYLPRIKECALLSCDVNYTPMNSYMTFNDGSMVSYEMSLQFQELEPIYEDDYSNLGDANTSNESVGY